MAKVRKTKDRLKYKIGDLIVELSPLSVNDKNLAASVLGPNGQSNFMLAAGLAIKMAVKSVKGLENEDGSEYQLQFEENGRLTDESVDDLLNCDVSGPLSTLVGLYMGYVPTEDKLPEGVSLVKSEVPNEVKLKE